MICFFKKYVFQYKLLVSIHSFALWYAFIKQEEKKVVASEWDFVCTECMDHHICAHGNVSHVTIIHHGCWGREKDETTPSGTEFVGTRGLPWEGKK